MLFLTDIIKSQEIWNKIISIGMPSTIVIIFIVLICLIIKYLKIKRIIYTIILLGVITLICILIWYFKDNILGIVSEIIPK
ncbi:hypothetical protein [Spiroplasma endosymbiont of Polydrusus pterygomalis]|uniref:hypothetical protein n=1 Tax=Spiroplasma endosymbiont of Polydrusus pterygomalis TaxID=3139327 RepID=UPI003CCAFD44